ncbi:MULTISPECIES: NUDIX hydrolase [unclassified Luteococcus]|uniref:NUDIX hydrolase n=1 Tax=unclassified Luteococcus TaxID=2639923 RepID=UPI00313CE463
MNDHQPVIRVSAVVLRDERGHFLTVRKRGTSMFMFPGGKPEPGEDPAQTALRELHEELGVALDPDRLELIGTFSAAAANEAGHLVESVVFSHPSVPIHGVAAEIEELRWLDATLPFPADQAPLSLAVLRHLGF